MRKLFKGCGLKRTLPTWGFVSISWLNTYINQDGVGTLPMRRFANAWILTITLLAILVWASTASAGIGMPISVDWNDTTTSPGVLDGITVTLDDALSLNTDAADLTGPDYAAAPLTANTETADYEAKSNWTATFSQPVDNLLLYIVFWRGDASGVNPAIYTFDQPFTVLSGLGNATVSGGNTVLSIPDDVTANGILQFTGPVTSLSVVTNVPTSSAQLLTFGLILSPQPIPTLSEWGLIAMAAVLGIVGFMVIRRRKVAA